MNKLSLGTLIALTIIVFLVAYLLRLPEGWPRVIVGAIVVGIWVAGYALTRKGEGDKTRPR